jgi:hypothetical protein
VYLGVLLFIGSMLSVSERHAAISELFVHFSARKLLWLCRSVCCRLAHYHRACESAPRNAWSSTRFTITVSHG